MVTKKPPPKVYPPIGDSTLHPRHSGKAAAHAVVPPVFAELAAWVVAAAPPPKEAEPHWEETATAPAIVADAAAAGKAALAPHASAASPSLSNSGDGEKTAKDAADSPPAKPGRDVKKKAEDTAGAPPTKPKGSAVNKSSRKTVPMEEEKKERRSRHSQKRKR
jgi:hypothetical protein